MPASVHSPQGSQPPSVADVEILAVAAVDGPRAGERGAERAVGVLEVDAARAPVGAGGRVDGDVEHGQDVSAPASTGWTPASGL